ncbi:unnamed protein product [Bursaphelenchus xylophilus]|uniref:(pine wood nematode) hypothetical protein n=1 Tax=Bursaphelenchus xylophilus TaxID=6326 RepID=A0A1I7RXM4_BURXY|nr:unnamed protein product [Bursaphelenchus xylophilus]CAG9126590.1 unnamed protein product [Bursaphelenchus xylophilus]
MSFLSSLVVLAILVVGLLNAAPCILCGYQGGYRFNDYGAPYGYGGYGYGGEDGGMRYKTLEVLGIPFTRYQYGRYDYGDGPYGGGGFHSTGRGFYIGKK